MRRTLFFAVAGLALLTLASSFAVAAYAIDRASDRRPALRPHLAAAALPTLSLDEATSVELNRVIGARGVDRFGITPDSYAGVRVLGKTSVGTFYLVPGTHGACIVTLSAASCGDPGSPGDPALALATVAGPGDLLVGVGIARTGIQRVAMPVGSGVTSLPVSAGLFHIREHASTGLAAGGQAAAKAGSAAKRSAATAPQFSVDPGGGGGAPQCTHYSAPYGIYASGAPQCYQYAQVYPGFAATNGIAIRFNNIIDRLDHYDWWYLNYLNSDHGYYCCMANGFSRYGAIGGSQGAYKVAACSSPTAAWYDLWWFSCTTHW